MVVLGRGGGLLMSEVPLYLRAGDLAEGVAPASGISHMRTLIKYKLGLNQNYHTFTLILLLKIVV